MSSDSRGDYLIGLMTGTSVDGIDAVLVQIGSGEFSLQSTLNLPLPADLQQAVLDLCQPGDNEIDRAGAVSRQLSLCYAQACRTLLEQTGLKPEQIRAIGCHGQTVRHRPGDGGFSLQLGCPDTLAVETGIPVVSNFRNKDMALGGQGAPLVPPFHRQLFARTGQRRAIANIGGMANVTLLDGDTLLGGFDTGPGNVLMDAWCLQHRGKAYDENGDWAASGTVHQPLLNSMLADPYFAVTGPKSTGREYFNLPWLTQQLINFPDVPPEDVQATLLALTAQTIANALLDVTDTTACYVCGGGAFNQVLMNTLQSLLPGISVDSTQALGIHPQWVEGVAFAWLAWAHLNNVPGNVPAVTGASREAVLGTFTPAS